ncbi:MAG: hypothetical protein F9K40_04330 [Kofleriaceae bacterium]|nr:MAG: hypothetical protein F9K40_04330 [Kofleriaceae bacterium]MBZ0236278.1 hypothetical protein [Kofleriaceae bacterium]
MRRWLCVLVFGLAECNTASDQPDASWCLDCDRLPTDARLLGYRPAYPGGQQNCMTGQKVAWVIIQETPERLAKLACVPDGPVAEGGACTFGPVGETTGYDDCAAGFVCSAGTCADICALDPLSPPVTQCSSGTCTADPLLFANGADQPAYGVCR